MTTERYTADELTRRLQERRVAALRIDPRTAHGYWTYEQVLDPYGDFDLAPEEYCVGRCFWLFDPTERYWIEERDVRELNPEISDTDWRELVRQALRREAEANPPAREVKEFYDPINRLFGLGPEGYRRD